MKPLTVALGVMLFLALSVSAATELQARAGIHSKGKPPDPLAQIQLGPPISAQMISDWRTRDGFQFQPLQPSGHNGRDYETGTGHLTT